MIYTELLIVKSRRQNMRVSNKGRPSGKRRKNKKMIYRALTDPPFRKQLQEDPARALGVRELSKEKMKEVAFVLAAVKGIEAQIASVADVLLCANDGPCGIA